MSSEHVPVILREIADRLTWAFGTETNLDARFMTGPVPVNKEQEDLLRLEEDEDQDEDDDDDCNHNPVNPSVRSCVGTQVNKYPRQPI